MMRVKIWQQFASNHSSNFTAVGRFDTPEQAAQARHTFEEMLRAIYAEQRHQDIAPDSLTSIEQYYSHMLQVEWNPGTLDWAFQADWAARQFDSCQPAAHRATGDCLTQVRHPHKIVIR